MKLKPTCQPTIDFCVQSHLYRFRFLHASPSGLMVVCYEHVENQMELVFDFVGNTYPENPMPQ